MLYFQVHQPRRLRRFGFFDVGKGRPLFDDGQNEAVMQRVADVCYQPANRMLLELIRQFPQMRFTFSISGTALEQLQAYTPEVIESFRALAATGKVEFLGETYFHSLSCIADPNEFERQVLLHGAKVESLFGVKPKIFRNTELIYSDAIGRLVRKLGFEGILIDGVERILQGRNPDFLYEHVDRDGLKLFPRNAALSDDISFRFPDKLWAEWPLTPSKYLQWLRARVRRDGLITLGMDYETFGEHQKPDSGIFEFFRGLASLLSGRENPKMVTPSEVLSIVPAQGTLSAPVPISWADQERDLSAWLGNDLQKDAFGTLKSLSMKVSAFGDKALMNCCRYLQTSDHFYYMSTKAGSDGDVHRYFSPYPSPYEAFMNYMNVLSELSLALKRMKTKPPAMRSSFRRHDWKTKSVQF